MLLKNPSQKSVTLLFKIALISFGIICMIFNPTLIEIIITCITGILIVNYTIYSISIEDKKLKFTKLEDELLEDINPFFLIFLMAYGLLSCYYIDNYYYWIYTSFIGSWIISRLILPMDLKATIISNLISATVAASSIWPLYFIEAAKDKEIGISVYILITFICIRSTKKSSIVKKISIIVISLTGIFISLYFITPKLKEKRENLIDLPETELVITEMNN